ncbi:MAG: hypothetical protein HOL66_15685 [Rhodospirillaceae bacterium]|jgi:hypothetical protein|nr:hypothetical protein [Rhodospirillaceae bacterium]MBT4932697.1 hypothetical protein [Rhodospirillaceae bacterium]MBT5245679.1 hypothetical protein [Rhodospirillaceae bacterium]MBT5561222.1 hypothetical protein [Rhodospirillaceae bacterium]MBT6240515.1 hypothetical protein [Rhodospirillaceae bacterium]
MEKTNFIAAETALLKQLEEIGYQITDLTAEKLAIQRLLQRIRHDNLSTREVTRKNSFDRILIENKILKILKEYGKPVSSKELYDQCCTINHNLKQNTFRSHLHRMKRDMQIQPVKHRRGWWEYPDTE